MHLVQLLTTCQWHSPSVLSKKRSALLVFFCFIYFLKFYERMNVFFLQLVFKRQRNGHHTILPWKASEKKCHSRCQTLWGLWGVVSQYWQVFCSWSTNQFFFGMVDQDSQSINKNRPPYYILEVGNNKQIYFHSVLDKFIDQFLLQPIQGWTLTLTLSLAMTKILSEITQCAFWSISSFSLTLRMLFEKEMVQGLQLYIKFWCHISSQFLVSMLMQLKCL